MSSPHPDTVSLVLQFPLDGARMSTLHGLPGAHGIRTGMTGAPTEEVLARHGGHPLEEAAIEVALLGESHEEKAEGIVYPTVNLAPLYDGGPLGGEIE